MNKTYITFIDHTGKVILEQKLTSMSLQEEMLISKSVEFFNDPEPCMIHRSAVMKRMYMEINEYLSKSMLEGKKQFAWDQLPAFIKTYISAPSNTIRIKVNYQDRKIKNRMRTW